MITALDLRNPGVTLKGETNMYKVRKDDKGRILNTGESQKNGRYQYKYVDYTGKTCYVYSNRLKKTDKTPAGRRSDLSLREKIEKIKRDQMDGILGGGDMTVVELVERYISTRTGVKKSTKAGYQTVLNTIKKDPFSANRIDRVKLSDAKMWFIKLQQKDGKGYSTIHTIRGVLRPAFQMAVDDDLIRKNPFNFPLMEVVINDSKVREALTPKQERDFLKFIKEDPHYSKYYDGFFILFNTGLRISEFCGVTKADVDFKNGCIHVRGQLVRHTDMLMAYETTKTAAGERDVPMSGEVAQCFKNIWKNRPKLKVEPIIDGRTGFYWIDQHGKPMVALRWEHYCNRIVEKYNSIYKVQMPNVTPHVMRHTFCSKMARKGMNPKNLQYIMGHSEISVTMDTYTHLGFEDAKEDFLKVVNGSEE